MFDEDDEEVLEAHAAEGGGEDGDAQLRPFHGSSAEHGGGGEEEGEGGGEEEDDALGGGSSWNLRKCSAAGLDMLSNVFGDALLPVLLPIVEARLKERAWPARESAILALGAPRWRWRWGWAALRWAGLGRCWCWCCCLCPGAPGARVC